MATIRQRQHFRLSEWVIGVGLAVGFSVGVPAVPAPANDKTLPTIVRHAGPSGPYYHMHCSLTAAAIDFAASDRQTKSGGQFTLRLHPEHFPLPAPYCRSTIILRMPWTDPTAPDAMSHIAAKEALLVRILSLAQAPQAVVPVVLELNPYVEVIRHKPLRLRLTQCNVFFRHAFGGYVDHTGPLQRD